MDDKKISVNNSGLGITVDDGMETVPVRNKKGDIIGTFYFRPTDIGIIDRYNEVIDKVADVFKPLESISIKSDGTVDESMDDELRVIKEAEQKLYDLCDYLFGGNLSEAFFGKMHPFSPLANGVFYCENALEGVGNFISNRFQGRVKGLEKRLNHYTHGYKSRTGKHRKAKR